MYQHNPKININEEDGLDERHDRPINCLKSEEALAVKITIDSQAKGINERQGVEMITDVLRYTAIFPEKILISSAKALVQEIPKSGNNLLKARNYFGSNGIYEGINMVFGNSDTSFELLIHTEESVLIREQNHPHYRVYRAPGASEGLREMIASWMRNSWKGFLRPDNYEEFPDWPVKVLHGAHYYKIVNPKQAPGSENCGKAYALFRIEGIRVERYVGNQRWIVPPFAGQIYMDTTGMGGGWATIDAITDEEAEEIKKDLFPQG